MPMCGDVALQGREVGVVVVLTKNEEANLPDLLTSIRPLSWPVVVVDSGSQDGTINIAGTHGARVLEHPFETHARQWRWAIENLPVDTEWVLALDADQNLTAELAERIREFVAGNPSENGAYVARRQVFRGKVIRWGGYYPKYLLKLFRRCSVKIPDEMVDHHFVVDGITTRLTGDLIEANRNEDRMNYWIEKHNRYAVLQAAQEVSTEPGWSGRVFGTPDERTRWMKSLWAHLPLYVRPVLYFLYRYVLRLGFLDGKEGFLFHFLQGFWYRLLVDINIEEHRNVHGGRADRGRMR